MDGLRHVLAEEPERAGLTNASGETPLFGLPSDEERALEVAELLLRHGPHPATRDAAGETALDVARRRGLDSVAELLWSAGEAAR